MVQPNGTSQFPRNCNENTLLEIENISGPGGDSVPGLIGDLEFPC